MYLKMDFKKMGFIIHTNYIRSELIEVSPPQADMNYLELVLEVNDVVL